MSHGQGHEHEHQHLDELHEVYLSARRAWRVAIRVHLEEDHGVQVGSADPERVHRQLHGG